MEDHIPENLATVFPAQKLLYWPADILLAITRFSVDISRQGLGALSMVILESS